MLDVLKKVKDPIHKRLFLYLEEGNWQKANAIIEEILDQEPENGYAYLGKLMIDTEVHVFAELMDLANPLDNNINYKRCLRFCDEQLAQELSNVNRYIVERNQIVSKVKKVDGAVASKNKAQEHSKSQAQEDDDENKESMKEVFKRMLCRENITQLFSFKGVSTSKEFWIAIIISVIVVSIGVFLMSFITSTAFYRRGRRLWLAIFWIPFVWTGLCINMMACMKRMSTVGIKFNIAGPLCIGILTLMGIVCYNGLILHDIHYLLYREIEMRAFVDYMTVLPVFGFVCEIVIVSVVLLLWKFIRN